MKNKILMAGALTMVFAIAGNAYAVGQNSNSGTGTGNQAQQQTQTANQGEDSQIQTQNSEQAQSGNTTGTNTGTQNQQQIQQELQDGSGAGNQVQNQNQIKNQGETNQIQNSEQEGTQNKNKAGSVVAEQRRSQVANAVQEMLQVAERNGGIGQQVKTIAQTQTQNQEKLEMSLEKVQSRGGFAKFFVGPNYGEINNAKKILKQNREQIERLDQVKNQLASQGDQQQLAEQIKTLEQANLEIENSLGTAQKGFSLFGWMFRLFSK
ncbi:MAG: hypothetical protein V1801_00190 [Candidatus Falkowbacteria bacterium]